MQYPMLTVLSSLLLLILIPHATPITLEDLSFSKKVQELSAQNNLTFFSHEIQKTINKNPI